MAFDAKYLICKCPVSPDGASTWTYRDTSTLVAMAAANYLVDGYHRGVRLGDSVELLHVDNQADPTVITGGGDYYVSAVDSVGGGVSLTVKAS